jgi:hypothetical protein
MYMLRNVYYELLIKKKKKECVLWVGLVTRRHATVMTHLYVCKKKKKKGRHKLVWSMKIYNYREVITIY